MPPAAGRTRGSRRQGLRGQTAGAREASGFSERTGPGGRRLGPERKAPGARAPRWGRRRSGVAAAKRRTERARVGGPRDAPRRGTPAHRASVLNDDLLGQHDTAVRGPFLLLPLGHFTILDSWHCCSHSRGGRPQRRVPSGHYCPAEPLGVPAAILRARPASGSASHRAIRRGALAAPPRPAHVTPPRPSGGSVVAEPAGSPRAAGGPSLGFRFIGSQ